MGRTPLTVLIVDDDAPMRDVLAQDLTDRGYRCELAATGAEALERLAAAQVDVVVTDVRMADMDGIELCGRVNERDDAPPVIVMTGFGSIETAVAAMKGGAFDFIAKPFVHDVLVLGIERAVEHRRLKDEVSRLRDDLADGAFGASPAMGEVRELIERVAPLDVGVLLTGETGTGKEVVARELHRRSRRRDGPFVAVNTTALPDTLLESELFGHEKGAFTDARTSRRGLFVEASGGTLFLDEIGHMPLPMQPKLLRALQERTVRPLGGTRDVPFDVRIVSATSLDLEAACASGAFREDLFYRLNVVHIPLPALRERGADVLALAAEFLRAFAERHERAASGFSPDAAALLLAYPWPGNVRELANCIERAVALARGDVITEADLPPRVREFRPGNSPVLLPQEASGQALVTLAEVERHYIDHVMRAVGQNKTRAAAVLGVDRKTLLRKLRS